MLLDMLNIRKWDKKQVEEIIKRTILKEEKEVLKYVNDYEGLCKVFGTNLYDDLSSYGFKLSMINIKDLDTSLKEHIFLILTFKDLDSLMNYVLIDPTYNQFVKKDNMSINGYSKWPSEILSAKNNELYSFLLYNKYSYINNKDINDYIESFTNQEKEYDIESLVIDNYKGKTFI